LECALGATLKNTPQASWSSVETFLCYMQP